MTDLNLFQNFSRFIPRGFSIFLFTLITSMAFNFTAAADQTTKVKSVEVNNNTIYYTERGTGPAFI